jgi:hypothetical protein
VAEQAGVGADGLTRPTEDRVVVLPHAVVLLDGATSLRPELPSGGWYATKLADEIAARLTATPEAELKGLLADAIRALAERHGLVPGAAPSSTVALVRWTDERIDALVLADSPVVAFTDEGPQVLTDDRLSSLPRRQGGYRDRLRDGAGFGPEHLAALRAGAQATGSWRNREGGFWVAEADPEAGHQAKVASWPMDRVRAVMMASDGVACGVTDYRLFSWPEVLELGQDAVLRAVRDAEAGDPDGTRWPRPKVHDDQALVIIEFRL